MAIANSVNAVAGGYQVLLATGDYAARTLTGTASQISITNGSGSTGNPVLSLPQNIDTAASVTFATAILTGTSGLYMQTGRLNGILSYYVRALVSGTLSVTHTAGGGTVGVKITYSQYNTSTGASKVFEFYSGAVGQFASGSTSSGPTSIWRHDFGGTTGALTTWAFANIASGSFDINYTIPANNLIQATFEIIPFQ